MELLNFLVEIAHSTQQQSEALLAAQTVAIQDAFHSLDSNQLKMILTNYQPECFVNERAVAQVNAT